MESNYQEIKSDGVYYELPASLYHVSGGRSAELLHGQLTNHIKGLQNNAGNYNLLLNLKGRVVADLDVLKIGDQYHFIASNQMAPKILEHFQKYHTLMGTQISRVPDIRIFHRLGELKLQAQQYGDGVYQSNRLGLKGYDCLVSNIGAPAPQTDQKLWDIIRVENGIPLVGQDVTEKHLPQEGRLDHALHFDKGCYLGQEIIARLHYKGQVKKFLTGILIETTGPLRPPLPVLQGNTEIGTVTSLVKSPDHAGLLGLAILPDPTGMCQVAGQQAQTITLPLAGC